MLPCSTSRQILRGLLTEESTIQHEWENLANYNAMLTVELCTELEEHFRAEILVNPTGDVVWCSTAKILQMSECSLFEVNKPDILNFVIPYLFINGRSLEWTRFRDDT